MNTPPPKKKTQKVVIWLPNRFLDIVSTELWNFDIIGIVLYW